VSILALELKNICKHFGGIQALKGVDFHLKEGEIHALIGENGAGKSTLVKIITGVYKPDDGNIILNGQETTMENPIDSRKKGIGVIYQELSLIDSISVGENIFLGNEADLTVYGYYDRRKLYKKSLEYLQAFNIDINPGQVVSELRMGQKRVIEIVKALALNAHILLLDEPTTGMSQKEIETLFNILDLMRKKKVTMIYISHYLEEVFRICNRVTVFRDGRNIETFETNRAKKEQLVKAMIGREMDTKSKVQVRDFSAEETVFELSEFQTDLMKAPISLKLRKGEILGITGIIGSGKSELAHSIFGNANSYKGTMTLHGKEKKIHSTIAAQKNKIAFIPEDRKSEGLFLDNTLAENMMVVNIDKSVGKSGLLSKSKVIEYTKKIGRKLTINPLRPDMLVRNYSGGNQQKIVIGKWLLKNPELIVMDEPTRGIDVGAKSEIYGHIKNLAEMGKAILVLSSEYEELMELCDRILVLRAGEVSGEFFAQNVSGEEILSMSLGVGVNE
jgi:ribose transport system ATP-binding protein